MLLAKISSVFTEKNRECEQKIQNWPRLRTIPAFLPRKNSKFIIERKDV